MRCFSILPLVGLVSTQACLESANRSTIPQNTLPVATQNILPVTIPPQSYVNLTSDEAHANVLRNYRADYIISSDTLYQYLKQNIGSNHSVYVSDKRRWIYLPSVYVPATKRAMIKRQGDDNPCFGYTNHYVMQTGSWWNSWSPASSCQYNGDDPDSATYQVSWSFSLSISENAG